MWSKSEMNNFYLRKINEATYKLTEKLSYEVTINCFSYSLIKIFKTKKVYYYTASEDEETRLKNVYPEEEKTADLKEEYMDPLIENFNRSFINVIENAMRFETLEESSYIDGLTDLPKFQSFLEEFKLINTKNEFNILSVIVLDLDFFKQLNDQHRY